MKKIITLLALAFCVNGKAQTYVAIPDSNFVHYLKTIVPTAFKGDSLNTGSTLVTTTTHSIIVQNKSIASLSGIQYFTSLTYLNCSSNPTNPNPNTFTSIPTLPNTLTYLFCAVNSLTSLPALPNTLTYLNCCNSHLTSLPALPNSLTWLECQVNYLTTLPALPNSLNYLQCDNNNITCFPTFPNSINTGSFLIDPNPYNCLPNYIAAMNAADSAKPLCAAGNSNGCAIATGINQFENNKQLNIYPNPTSNIFTIEATTTDKQTLQVFDVNGKLVLSQIINGKTNIDASNLAEGVYNLSVINQSGVVNKRLVIVR
ncbi:MAG TPA: T9SS type A sorting domain-containing protein [Bacteroidia bacterium]|jgi:hypothetical protein|nr:T9SS type A sorting domain-containing protein [Bacteroidia bacterium]